MLMKSSPTVLKEYYHIKYFKHINIKKFIIAICYMNSLRGRGIILSIYAKNTIDKIQCIFLIQHSKLREIY